MRYFLAVLITVSLGTVLGCSEPEKVVQEQIRIEDDYLQLLDEMAELMRKDMPEPAQNLEALRGYIETSQAKSQKVLNELNRQVLNMDEETRLIWRKTAKPRVAQHLEAFAQAQIHLQKRLNDAQKWELGEILALLKI